jgi:hypothetical protein
MKTVTATSLALHLCCDRGTIDTYRLNHVIERLPDGRFDQDECRERAFKHLRERAAGRSGRGESNLANERALLAKEQRETAAIRNAASRAELVHVRDVQRVVEGEYGVIKENFLSAPGANANALATAARDAPNVESASAIIEGMLRDFICEILENLSNPDSVARKAGGRQKGRRR